MSEHVRTVIAAVKAARRGGQMSDATRAAIAAREAGPEPPPEPKKLRKAEPEPEPSSSSGPVPDEPDED